MDLHNHRFRLHSPGQPFQDFPTLTELMQFVYDHKISGYAHIYTISTGEVSVINLKNGKRPGSKPGTWVPAVR